MATLVQLCHSLRLFPIPLSFQIRDLGFLLCLMKEGLMNLMQRSKEGLMKKGLMNEMQRSKEGLMKKMQRKKMEVSKLGKLKCKDEHDSVQDVKADDLRKMLLAMTVEVRVIIVKLANRLHNIRTLSHMPPHKQSSIARETLQVFAPLAKLLGMYQIKLELENLSFMYTNPEDYAKIRRKVADLYKEHEKELVEANKILVKKIEDDQFLELMTVKTEVRAVCKEPYSIYKSVLKSKGSINEVNQIAQLRIVIKPKPCLGGGPLCTPQQICYHVLGLVHGIWTPIHRTVPDATSDHEIRRESIGERESRFKQR